jgi:hypothetical protein
MQNIDFEVGDNLGGLEELYFIPKEDLLSIPDALKNVISDNLELDTDKKFYIAKFVLDSLNFNESKDTNKNGTVYKQKITGTIAKDQPELASLLLEMSERHFICIYKDRNDHYKLVGNLENFLTLDATELDTDNNYTGRNSYKIAFKGESTKPSFFYEGIIETYDTVIVTDPPLTCEPVTIRDGAGNVIDTVESGGEFYITLISANQEVLT